jgi:methylmalonyl-CoA mutase C-terminal domain/subunit
MEVIYLGSRQSPEQIAETAIQEDVDVVGLSCLSGAHMSLFPRIVKLIKEKGGKNKLMLAGGIIPDYDISKLNTCGIAQVFGPGTPVSDISNFIFKNCKRLSV